MPTDPISVEEANARLEAELQDLDEALEFSRRHDDRDVEAEFVSSRVRRHYEAQEAFDNG